MREPPFGLFGLHDHDRRAGDAPADAARLMWFARLIRRTAGVPVFALSTLLSGGSARAQIFGPDERVMVRRDPLEPTEQVQAQTLFDTRLAWMPEGIVFVPRSAAAPKGWGLPATEDGLGTPGGDFPFVLLNHHEHANYPDYLASVYASAESDAHRRLNWPAQHQTYELEPGYSLRIGAAHWTAKGWSVLPQFAGRWLPLLRERRQESWFCHRPQPVTLRYDSQAEILTRTNALRADEGKPPVFPALRGWSASLADAVLAENKTAARFGHDSPNFRAGWQSAAQRTAWRYSAANGEIIAGAPFDWHAAQMGQAAVEAWTNSPSHRAAMVADYTSGWRASRANPNTYSGFWESWIPYNSAAIGAAQIFAETTDIGVRAPASYTGQQIAPYNTWPPLYAEGPFSGSGAAQVFGSVLSTRHLACRQVWSHPEIGSLYVGGEPGIPMVCPFQRIFWAARDFVRFKHAVWRLLPKNTSSVARGVVGACLTATAPDAQAVSLYPAMVAEKQRREARVPGNTCTGSESEVPAGEVGRGRQLRVVYLEQHGPDLVAPPYLGSRRLVYATPTGGSLCPDPAALAANAPAGAWPVPMTELASYTLPGNFVEIGYGVSSRDGSQTVVAFTELTPAPPTRWTSAGAQPAVKPPVGERMRFVRFDDSGAALIHTSELPVTVATTSTLYRQAVDARVHLLPVFGGEDGNQLQWLDMRVVGSSQRPIDVETGNLANPATSSIRCDLIWPGGVELTVADMQTSGASIQGYSRHLMYIDPARPAHTVHAQFDITAPGAVSARAVAGGATIKALYSGLAMAYSASAVMPLTTHFGANIDRSALLTGSNAAGDDLPAENFFGAFWHGSAGSANGMDRTRYADDWRPHVIPMAPVFVTSHIFWNGGDVQWIDYPSVYRQGLEGVINAAQYDGKVVVAGWLSENVAGLTKTRGPADRWFRWASFDLGAATRIAGLSNNILPLWSM